MQDRIAPPTLDHLQEIIDDGHAITDIWFTKHGPDKFREIIYLKSGLKRTVVVEASSEHFKYYFREAVELCGFGPRGLGCLIHLEIIERSKSSGLPQDRFTALLSQECFYFMGQHAEHWTIYNYDLAVSRELSGMSYAIIQKGNEG